MIGTNIAIDFGSSSTELYVQGKGVILDGAYYDCC